MAIPMAATITRAGHMTEGDARAEADRAAAVLTMQRADTGPKAFLEGLRSGYRDGMLRAIALIEAARIEMHPLHDCSTIEALQLAIDLIGNEVES